MFFGWPVFKGWTTSTRGQRGIQVFGSIRSWQVFSSSYGNSCIHFCIPLDGITPVCVQLMEFLAALVILYKQSSGIITVSEHPVWRSAGPSISGLVKYVLLYQTNKLILKSAWFGINYSHECRTHDNLHDMLASFAALIFKHRCNLKGL